MPDRFERYERIYNVFYRIERCGAISLSDGGGPFGFDILVALLFDDLIAAYKPDGIIECGSFVGDTTTYLAEVYSPIAIKSCDVDSFSVSVTRHRTKAFPNVQVNLESSTDLVARVDSAYTRPLYFLDAHGVANWPLTNELESMTHGLAVVHDFDIEHPRFSFDHYDGISCDAKLLSQVFSPGMPFFTLNAHANSPFPCLQVGRRSGVAVLPLDKVAESACIQVMKNSRCPLVQAVIPRVHNAIMERQS
jgi:hypothetical protein